MIKHYRIADLNVSMDTFGITEERAKKYLCEPFDKPDIFVTSKELLDSGVNYHDRWAEFDDDWREHFATLAIFCRKLIHFDGMRFHASAVVVDGKVYLFSADPGTGKSTHTNMWLKLFGDRAYILNDDKPVIRLIDGVLYAYGTPWSGKYDISVNLGVPVAGVALLERYKDNVITRADNKEALLAIMRQLNRPRDGEYRRKMMNLTDRLIQQVPIWKLKCNMDPEAAIISYEAMSGQKFKKGE